MNGAETLVGTLLRGNVNVCFTNPGTSEMHFVAALDDYKNSAPEIPTNTCPYIDFIKEIIQEVKDETDSQLIKEKLELANNSLEYIRISNESLRQSSHYWFIKFKNIFK